MSKPNHQLKYFQNLEKTTLLKFKHNRIHPNLTHSFTNSPKTVKRHCPHFFLTVSTTDFSASNSPSHFSFNTSQTTNHKPKTQTCPPAKPTKCPPKHRKSGATTRSAKTQPSTTCAATATLRYPSSAATPFVARSVDIVFCIRSARRGEFFTGCVRILWREADGG